MGLLNLPGRRRSEHFAGEKGRPLSGSSPEKVFAVINGVRQGMFIQSTDPAHPVLLCLHGGLPEYFLTERYPTGLENDFTVVWWEQRGAGLSYSPAIPAETMTLEQFIADTLAVTDYLRDRFSKQKIYLMAHSGGTFIGLQAAARAPQVYCAYVGVAQMVHQLESERRAYGYMLERFKRAGNGRMVRKLEATPVTMTAGTPGAYLALRDKAMHSLGVGTAHDMTSVLRGIVWPSLKSPHYTLGEKVRLWRGKRSSGVSALWDEMLAVDLADRVTKLALPAYFFHGVYDYTVNYQLAKDYVEKLKAPVKGFVEEADHMGFPRPGGSGEALGVPACATTHTRTVAGEAAWNVVRAPAVVGELLSGRALRDHGADPRVGPHGGQGLLAARGLAEHGDLAGVDATLLAQERDGGGATPAARPGPTLRWPSQTAPLLATATGRKQSRY